MVPLAGLDFRCSVPGPFLVPQWGWDFLVSDMSDWLAYEMMAAWVCWVGGMNVAAD